MSFGFRISLLVGILKLNLRQGILSMEMRWRSEEERSLFEEDRY